MLVADPLTACRLRLGSSSGSPVIGWYGFEPLQRGMGGSVVQCETMLMDDACTVGSLEPRRGRFTRLFHVHALIEKSVLE